MEDSYFDFDYDTSQYISPIAYRRKEALSMRQ